MPVVQNIQKYLDEKRKQENLKKFLDGLNKTRSDVENVYDSNIIKGRDLPNQIQPTPRKTQDLIGPREQPVPQRPELPAGDPALAPITMSEANRKANRQLADYLYGIVATPNEDVSSEQKQLGANMLSQIIKGEQPPESEYYNLGKGQKRYERTGTGEDRVVAENIVDEPVNYDIEGKFENEDTGTYWTYDKLTGKPIDTNIPYDKSKGVGDSISRERFEYQKEKDVKKEADIKRKAQFRYNQIMDSYKTVDQLRALGLSDYELKKYEILRKEGDKYYKEVGGAYYYIDDKGKKIVFPATKDVEERIKKYADEQTYDAPNKWGREKNSSGKDKKKPKIEY